MLNYSAARQADLTTPVDCVGYVVETAITDSFGITRYQTGSIKRRLEDAAQIAAMPVKHLPHETVTRSVVKVRTCFPMADVLAGNATRYELEVESRACVQSTAFMTGVAA